MEGEHGNVAGSGPERREEDGECVKAEEEVCAESSGCHLFLQVAVACGYDADIDGNELAASEVCGS